jgi:hypothetical protein
VLDGLLYHESDLRIEEHDTDTAGFTDHVFALMHLLGFRFAPRIRDLADKRLFVPGKPGESGTRGAHRRHDQRERDPRPLAGASLMLRKLGSYLRQNVPDTTISPSCTTGNTIAAATGRAWPTGDVLSVSITSITIDRW